MKIFFLAVTLVIFSVTEGSSQSAESFHLQSIPLLKHFDATDYLGGIQNWAFDQDSSGLLYVANNNGLLEFDGNIWTRYDIPNCTKVRAVLVDELNRIFIGGQGQIGYFTSEEQGLEFYSLMDLLPESYQNIAETWKIHEHNDKIYFNTESQLLTYDGDEIRIVEVPGYIQNSFTVNNTLLAQFLYAGLFEIVDDELIKLNGTENLPVLNAVFNDDDGYLGFTRAGALIKYSNNNIVSIQLPISPGTINTVLKMASGDYIVGTQNSGLFILSPDFKFKQHLSKNAGLSDRTIRALHEDGHHNLWVALNNGIDYLELSLPFSLINDEIGLEGTGYAASYFNNQLYLGTNNGFFVQDRGDELYPSRYKLMPGSDGQVYNFSIIGNNIILNHDKGAFKIGTNKLLQFHDLGSWKFTESPVPGLILGGDYQGISFYAEAGDAWTPISRIPDFTESSRLFEFESDTTLWMSHGSKGAYRLVFDHELNLKKDIEHFGVDHGFPSNNMISVYVLNDKLIFTGEEGIYNFDYESYSFVPNPFLTNWLGRDHVSAIIADQNQSIYYIQGNKLGVLKQESFEVYKKETAIFNHINHMLSDDLPNISVINERNMLFGAKEGFIVYDPERKFSASKNFQILIRSIEIRKESDSALQYYSPSFIDNLRISRRHLIKFRYAAPYYDGYADIKYSYRLMPMDKTWSDWSRIGEKEYSYLPPGEYTFEIKAKNVYELESKVNSFSFKVVKPWYITDWAIIFYFLVGLGLVFLILWFQQRKYREEKSIITKDKDQVLRTKNEEIIQISQESKKEIERLQHEKLRTEIDLKNEQLTTITMHLMKNSGVIQEALRNIESNLDRGGSKEELKRIIRSIEKNLAKDDSWDQFAYHFDQVHGDYLKKLSQNNIRLSPREIKLAAFLRMNMSSKEISKMMNITPRSVELARHRLRKKLKLSRNQNLVEYLIDLDNK